MENTNENFKPAMCVLKDTDYIDFDIASYVSYIEKVLGIKWCQNEIENIKYTIRNIHSRYLDFRYRGHMYNIVLYKPVSLYTDTPMVRPMIKIDDVVIEDEELRYFAITLSHICIYERELIKRDKAAREKDETLKNNEKLKKIIFNKV